MKNTFLFKFLFLKRFFRITSLQVIKKKLLYVSILGVSMLIESLISIKIKTKVVFIVLIKSPSCTNVFYCQCTRQGASFMLSHIGLLSLVVGYCIIGAFIFEVVNCLKTNFPLPGARGGYIILLKYVFLFFNRTYPIDNDPVKTFF